MRLVDWRVDYEDGTLRVSGWASGSPHRLRAVLGGMLAELDETTDRHEVVDERGDVTAVCHYEPRFRFETHRICHPGDVHRLCLGLRRACSEAERDGVCREPVASSLLHELQLLIRLRGRVWRADNIACVRCPCPSAPGDEYVYRRARRGPMHPLLARSLDEVQEHLDRFPFRASADEARAPDPDAYRRGR